MNFRHLAALAPSAVAVAASLMLAGPASATFRTITYQGVVTAAYDDTAEFGVGAHAGQSFLAQVVFDDAKAGAVHDGGVYYDAYHGDGAASPLSATIFVNGVSMSFGATSGQDYRVDRNLQPGCLSDCTDVSFQQNAEDRYVLGNLYTLNYINLGGMSSTGGLSGIDHGALNYTNPPIDLYAYVALFEQDIFTLESHIDSSLLVRIDTVFERGGILTDGGVPEPGVWALMLMGFGGVGALLRRRRAAFAPA